MTKKQTRKSKQQSSAKVIIPASHPNPPEPHKVDAAWVVAHHHACVIKFLVPVDDYKRKIPDCVLLGALTEIKSPKGRSRKNTVREQF